MVQFERLNPAIILLVEDDALVQLELAAWLGDLGLTVLTADNADEARALLETRADIDCLLTDIQMPGAMNGIHLAHHVAGHWPPIKIIVMSGMVGTELCALPPGSCFLPKPVDREKLWRALSRLGAPDTPSAPSAPIPPPARLRPPPRFGCA
jgi:CheY-like chemotaxis protein